MQKEVKLMGKTYTKEDIGSLARGAMLLNQDVKDTEKKITLLDQKGKNDKAKAVLRKQLQEQKNALSKLMDSVSDIKKNHLDGFGHIRQRKPCFTQRTV